jgi:hypothetical protein
MDEIAALLLAFALLAAATARLIRHHGRCCPRHRLRRTHRRPAWQLRLTPKCKRK